MVNNFILFVLLCTVRKRHTAHNTPRLDKHCAVTQTLQRLHLDDAHDVDDV